MREFATEVVTRQDDEDLITQPVEIKIDGRVTKFAGITTSQLAVLVASQGGRELEQVAAFVNFFFSLLEKPEDMAHYKKRLFDRNDHFGAPMMGAILEALVEEWSANPTQPSGTSTPSPPRSGARSTAKRASKASTRSR